MFLPGESALLNGNPVIVSAVNGHIVTVDNLDDVFFVEVPETHLSRPLPQAQNYISSFDPKKERLPYGLVDEMQKILVKMNLDWNGHHASGTYWNSDGWCRPEKERRRDLFRSTVYLYDTFLTVEGAEKIIEAFKSGVSLDYWTPIGEGEPSLCCSNCKNRAFETNGTTVRPTKPCQYPDGIVTEFTLNVPSGKMVIANDLRYLCRIGDNSDINSTYGTHRAILNYAKSGLACGFGVGNTCPTVAKHKGGRFTIGRRQGGRRVTGICTDLWAYSIMDYEEALRRVAYYEFDLESTRKSLDSEVVKVPAGLYRFRHYHGQDRDASKILFAEFERIGPATEPDDWIGRDKNFQAHISQVVQHQADRWPTLYGRSQNSPEQFAPVVHSQFRGCVPDRDWHPNGHRNDFMRDELDSYPILDIPHFRFQFSWSVRRSIIDTAVSRNDELFGGDTPLNESYAIAAGRVLESVISFGLPTRHNTETEISDWEADRSGRVKIPNPHYDTYNTSEVREEMHKAASLWHGLIERYPHVATESPIFAAWMENREAVSKWIDAFDLGPTKFDRAAWNLKKEAEQKVYLRVADVHWMKKSGTSVQRISTGAVGVSQGSNKDKPDTHVDVLWDRESHIVAEELLDDLQLSPDGIAAKTEAQKKMAEEMKALLSKKNDEDYDE